MSIGIIRIVFGVAGVAIGGFELGATRIFARLSGVEGKSGTVRFMGARELATGIAVLAMAPLRPWMLIRAIGDVFDAAVFTSAARRGNPRQRAAMLMAAASMGAFVVDAAVAIKFG